MWHLFNLIDDPLYRFALWVLFAQILVIVIIAFLMLILKFVRPRMEQKQKQERLIARHSLMHYLNYPEEEIDITDTLQKISYRALFQALEHLYSRVSLSERSLLHTIIESLQLESYALTLTQSWFWWRRLEGVMILGTVAGLEGEANLVHRLKDKYSSVSFHAAWSLVRISPIHSRPLIIEYLTQSTGLSFAQSVRLLRELDVTDLSENELLSFFQEVNDRLKPQLIEALVYSHGSHATHLVNYASKSDNKEIRIAAFKAASQFRFNLKEIEISKGVRDESWEVRAQAVKAVGESRMHNLIPLLAQSLADQNWWVRQNTAWALTQLGEAGLEALGHVAHLSKDNFARDTARLALSEILMKSQTDLSIHIDTLHLLPTIPQTDELSTVLLDPNHTHHLNTQELNLINLK
jgi:HEAT repeat protein